MTSTFTANIGIERPGLGDYTDDWNIPVNADWTLIDQALGSSTSISMASGPVTLTVAQAAYYMIILTGALSGNTNLILPAGVGGGRQIFNQTTGGFLVTVLNGAGDTGGGVATASGYSTPVVLTGARAYYDNYQAIAPGTPLPFAGANPPPGFLLAFGQTLNTASYPALAAALGTSWGTASAGQFVMPDFRGRVLAGADDMGGTPAGNLTGYSFGVIGGEQTHALTTPELASHNHGVNDPGHNHGVNDPGHNHPYTIVGGPGNIPGGSGIGQTGATTGTSTTDIGINTNTTGITTQNRGGGQGHNNVQPTAAINYMIRY